MSAAASSARQRRSRRSHVVSNRVDEILQTQTDQINHHDAVAVSEYVESVSGWGDKPRTKPWDTDSTSQMSFNTGGRTGSRTSTQNQTTTESDSKTSGPRAHPYFTHGYPQGYQSESPYESEEPASPDPMNLDLLSQFKKIDAGLKKKGRDNESLEVNTPHSSPPETSLESNQPSVSDISQSFPLVTQKKHEHLLDDDHLRLVDAKSVGKTTHHQVGFLKIESFKICLKSGKVMFLEKIRKRTERGKRDLPNDNAGTSFFRLCFFKNSFIYLKNKKFTTRSSRRIQEPAWNYL